MSKELFITNTGDLELLSKIIDNHGLTLNPLLNDGKWSIEATVQNCYVKDDGIS